MSKQELARQTFRQLVYTVQRSSKKRNARRKKKNEIIKYIKIGAI